MDTTKVTLTSPADIICFIPYVLGYQPIDRFCVLAIDPTAPTAGVQHPHDLDSLLEVAAALGAACRHHSGRVLVAYTDETDHALDAIKAVTAMLDGYVEVVAAFTVNGQDRWFSTDGTAGTLTEGDRSKVAATAAFAGRVAPAASREAQRHMFDTDTERAAEVEPLLTAHLPDETGTNLTEWARDRAASFTYDEETVTAADAARLIAAAATEPGLTAILDDLNGDDVKHQHPLWMDLMRRCPQSHRHAVALVVAVTAWLTGNGALAWHALDTLPEQDQRNHPVAVFVAEVLTEAVHPNTWAGWSVRTEAKAS